MYTIDMASDCMISVRKNIHGDRFRHLSTITVITAIIFEAANLVILIKRFMEYVVEINSSDIKVSSQKFESLM
jgi:hypothetical protein